MKRRQSTRKTTRPYKHEIPDIILSPSEFGRLLKEVRYRMFLPCSLLAPNVGEKALLARHCAMHVLRNHIGESAEAVQYRFSASAEEVKFALKDVIKALKASWALQAVVQEICSLFVRPNPCVRAGK